MLPRAECGRWLQLLSTIAVLSRYEVAACECTWTLSEVNIRLSGDGQKYIPSVSTKVACMDSCCHTESCTGFMFNFNGEDGMRCMTFETGVREDGFSQGWEAG